MYINLISLFILVLTYIVGDAIVDDVKVRYAVVESQEWRLPNMNKPQ